MDKHDHYGWMCRSCLGKWHQDGWRWTGETLEGDYAEEACHACDCFVHTLHLAFRPEVPA